VWQNLCAQSGTVQNRVDAYHWKKDRLPGLENLNADTSQPFSSVVVDILESELKTLPTILSYFWPGLVGLNNAGFFPATELVVVVVQERSRILLKLLSGSPKISAYLSTNHP
jgi:hypothetical protein